VDLREAEFAGPAESTIDFLFEVGAAVVLENLRLEVLDTQAEPRDAVLSQHLQLVLLKRAGFALEGDFASTVPRHDRSQASHEAVELRGAQIRWRAAAEVDVVERPASDAGPGRQQFYLLQDGIEIDFDVLGVLVGVDAEVTELAALPAEWDVQVKPERHASPR